MAAAVNGAVNGHNGHSDELFARFSDIPPMVELPVQDAEVGLVDLNLEELADDPTELCILLEDEHVPRKYWTMVAMAYAKQDKIDHSVEVINKAIAALPKNQATEKLHLYNTLCWLHLLKSRRAPRMLSDAQQDPDTKIKDFYLRAATATLNDASRINPSFQPLFLARGVLCLLRAALVQDQAEKSDILRQAFKAFDDANRASNGKNMMAFLGRARAKFTLGRWAESLRDYQHVLKWAPDIRNPDPRIGIGCCFWQLGYQDDAKEAWERALELSPHSKSANILLGIYYLYSSSKFNSNDPDFKRLYAKAMTGYTQTAFKLDNHFPMSCSMFSNLFLARKQYDNADKLARRAVELTDVSAIASDGWYARARMEHYQDNPAKAADFYQKSDQARGGDDRGFLPAKFGSAQLRVLHRDHDGAKFRLERIVSQTRNVEAMSLLGALLAEDVFSARLATPQEAALSTKRAISLLEQVRATWKDSSKHVQQDNTVLLNLARLYEVESPEKALQCLSQVEKAEIEQFADDDEPEDSEEAAAWLASIKEQLSPHLLNNIACFHFNAERYGEALQSFQIALKACQRLAAEDADIDSDALVTTISYNLARTYEAEHMLDEAKEVYEGLLQRHGDYTDARLRLTYIALVQSPQDAGPKAMAKLYETDSADLEVRALYGWFIRKAKKKTYNIAEDQEQRHFKHTLQNHDKHDRYALTGMGNLHMTVAREMRRETDQEKDKRRKMYERAVEFFDKAIQLDPRNAYAAQGIAIAMIEDRRDFSGALQIFSKVKETVRDSSVHVNLGHVYCELKQYSRAIESYEMALAKDRARDPQILACLGRAWLLRGKGEKNAVSMRTSLEYSQRALEVAPDQIHFRFNVAFVQIQIAQLLISLPETQRTLEELNVAAEGLDAAIESFSAIAKSPNPPFPRNDIEQRANMGRNTMRKQLERAVQKQREYEEKNADRLKRAREQREAELARRAEEVRRAEAEAAEQRRKVAEERRAMAERDRELVARRLEEEKRRLEEHEAELDSDGNEAKRKPRRKAAAGGKRKKAKAEDDFLNDGDVDQDGGASPPAAAEKPRKKRKLERKAAAQSKYKSAERIVDSDDDDDDDGVAAPAAGDDDDTAAATPAANGDADADADMADASAPVASKRRTTRVLDDEDEDEDEDEGDGDGGDQAPAPLFGDDDEEE